MSPFCLCQHISPWQQEKNDDWEEAGEGCWESRNGATVWKTVVAVLRQAEAAEAVQPG